VHCNIAALLHSATHSSRQARTLSQVHNVDNCDCNISTLLGRIACTQCTRQYIITVQKCVLSLPVLWSVCVCVYLLVTTKSCTKTAKPIEIQFGMWTLVGPRNHVVGGGLDLQGRGACGGDTCTSPLKSIKYIRRES